jgi:hypothetical protein
MEIEQFDFYQFIQVQCYLVLLERLIFKEKCDFFQSEEVIAYKMVSF